MSFFMLSYHTNCFVILWPSMTDNIIYVYICIYHIYVKMIYMYLIMSDFFCTRLPKISASWYPPLSVSWPTSGQGGSTTEHAQELTHEYQSMFEGTGGHSVCLPCLRTVVAGIDGMAHCERPSRDLWWLHGYINYKWGFSIATLHIAK